MMNDIYKEWAPIITIVYEMPLCLFMKRCVFLFIYLSIVYKFLLLSLSYFYIHNVVSLQNCFVFKESILLSKTPPSH
jgi:hypothetical protein